MQDSTSEKLCLNLVWEQRKAKFGFCNILESENLYQHIQHSDPGTTPCVFRVP